MTTVEARGTTDRRPGCREHNREGSVGRAAGAQLTGQRQDGPSHGPACEQHPRVAHGGAGSYAAPFQSDRQEIAAGFRAKEQHRDG